MEDLESASIRILRSLAESGYAHIHGPVTTEWFDAVSARLGAVHGRSDVVADRARDLMQQRSRGFAAGRPGIYTAAELGFHTDSPRYNLLAWYCVEQDEREGSNLLLDAGNVAACLAAEDLECLRGVHLWVPVRAPSGEETAVPAPLLTATHAGYEVYWAPWLLADDYADAQKASIERFRRWLEQKEREELIEVRLRPGGCLFADNSRMLHGRRALTTESRRHLVRLSIRAESLRGGVGA
jgi:hypothetical protein